MTTLPPQIPESCPDELISLIDKVVLSALKEMDLKASIAAKYVSNEVDNGVFMVLAKTTWSEITGKEHTDWLDADAEMEAIIQDEVKAAMHKIAASQKVIP